MLVATACCKESKYNLATLASGKLGVWLCMTLSYHRKPSTEWRGLSSLDNYVKFDRNAAAACMCGKTPSSRHRHGSITAIMHEVDGPVIFTR